MERTLEIARKSLRDQILELREELKYLRSQPKAGFFQNRERMALIGRKAKKLQKLEHQEFLMLQYILPF